MNMVVFKKIYDAVKAGGVVSSKDISCQLKMTPRQVNHHLRYYSSSGRIFKVGKGSYSIDPNAQPKSTAVKAKFDPVENPYDHVEAAINSIVRLGISK